MSLGRLATVLRALPVSLALCAALPAGAQWGPLHGDEEESAGEAEEDIDLSGFTEIPIPRAEPPPRERRPVALSLSAVSGYWGLGPADRGGWRGALGFGLRAEVDPLPWLPVEVLVLATTRAVGTEVITSRNTYFSAMLMAGWQYHYGTGIYAVQAGAAATRHHVAHRVVDGGTQQLASTGSGIGPAWLLSGKWRLGRLEMRLDAGSLWRERRSDLLLLLGVGWLPFAPPRQ